MQKKTLQVLEISSSGRRDGSITRQLSNDAGESMDRARAQIAAVIHLSAQAA